MELGDWMSLGLAFIPWAFVLIVAVAVALEVWLYRTRSGLGVRAVGFNADSGARIGLRVGLVRSTGLIGCALGAVIAGVFSLPKPASARTTWAPATRSRASPPYSLAARCSPGAEARSSALY